MKRFSVNSACPCGSGKKYKKCCAPLHKGAFAKNALELMKSRYSAYAISDIRYIIKTSLDKNLDESELKEFSKKCDFQKLEILEFIDGESETFVTFKASIFCDNIDNSFCEKSRFIKKDNRWLYVDGEFL